MSEADKVEKLKEQIDNLKILLGQPYIDEISVRNEICQLEDELKAINKKCEELGWI